MTTSDVQKHLSKFQDNWPNINFDVRQYPGGQGSVLIVSKGLTKGGFVSSRFPILQDKFPETQILQACKRLQETK